MKVAVYSGSRNLYPDMVTAAKSLMFNSTVDKIYFLIEDDVFTEELPPQIQTINVSGQKFFPKNGANFRTSFTYMSLMRVCYAKLFPDIDRILQLDVDTICTDNIDYLWEVDMNDKWFGAVVEDLGTYKPFGPKYYNIGVAIFNLEWIRKDGIDEKLIHYLNTVKVPYIDQDAWNRFGIGRDMSLPVRFNECFVTGYTEKPAIVHFAGHKDWQNSIRVPRREHIKTYRDMPWEQVLDEYSNRSTNL